MTQGGPLNSTNVFGSYLYEVAFQDSRYGYAAAIAVVMFFLVLILTLVTNRLTRREAVEY
jgi:ABC-type sugar transport system permease subunit